MIVGNGKFGFFEGNIAIVVGIVMSSDIMKGTTGPGVLFGRTRSKQHYHKQKAREMTEEMPIEIFLKYSKS